MRIEGSALIVDTGGGRPFHWSDWSGWSDWSNCRPELTINLAPEAAVRIAQSASRASLDGQFSAVAIDADAGDITFDGHATALLLSGAAMRARLAFDAVRHDEVIRLTGRMMDASLKFLVPTQISYTVEATASLVSSALANTPGAKPEITVKGEMLRLSIE
ncbi:hypothetical protein [Rhizobium halophytocola]|uniref:Uncharacterized protein n=1 Tax=Rhizobium halophytocola TaxID=735519 RepID=A0ABS4E5U9_9HYPH|nr:hypothetical protein [Rhizobium halophytocola]MBP1853312.1 hypothetical protein [Rhizobium halophytocola]